MSIADRYKDMVAEIQQLKAKNAELQEANDTFTLGAKRAIESNCKLYQENIKLEEALLRATLESGRKDKLYFKDTGKLRDENWKQIDEIKKLKEENASMNVVKWANDFRDLKEENKKLQEYLDKSREVSNRLIAENNTTMPSQSALYRENKKLKEELRDLKLSLID